MKKHQNILTVIVLLLAVASVYAQFPNVRVSSNTYDQSETAIAVSTLNGNYLIGAWNDFRPANYFAKAGYAVSLNGGYTWTEGIVRAPGNLTSYIYGFDPSVAIDRGGKMFYCYIATSGKSLGGTFVARSTDQGSTWDTVKQVSSTLSNQDKPFMTVDNTAGTYDGRIYVSWTDFSSGSAIKFAYSSDHGLTYSTPVIISSQSANPGSYPYMKPTDGPPDVPTTVFVQGSMPAVGANGEVYIVYMDVNYGYNAATMKVQKSTNGGATFGSAISAATFTWQRTPRGRLDILNLPSIAVSPTNGYVYIAYMDQVSSSNTDMRIKWVRSINGGTSWSAPVTIADQGTGWQFFPAVTVDGTGRITVGFMHSPNSTTVDAYFTASADDGVTFNTTKRVSNVSSNPSNASWTHHYMGITSISATNKIFELWTDYRNGNADPYFAGVITLNTSVYLGWNMVSVPDTVSNFAKAAVWTNSDPTQPAKRWDTTTATYVATDPVKTGDGYFVKFPLAGGANYIGTPIYSMTVKVSVTDATQWNLFGSISKSISTSSVIQNPPGIVISDFFKYAPGGYTSTTVIDPGMGIWVKLSQDGFLTLTSSSPKLNTAEDIYASLDKFTVKDNNGFSQDMFVRNGTLSLNKGGDGNVEMPPLPPDEFFSARFSTNNYVQTVKPENELTELPIVVKSAVYPLTLSWEVKEQNNIKYSLVYDGKEISLRGTNSLTINNPTKQAILLKATAGAVLVPQMYALNQNYPNPFNPQTRIDYSLPETKRVKLVIYDLLGREVVKLVDEVQDAGYKSVSFDGGNLPSGVYLYRLTIGKFTDVKKMILLR